MTIRVEIVGHNCDASEFFDDIDEAVEYLQEHQDCDEPNDYENEEL